MCLSLNFQKTGYINEKKMKISKMSPTCTLKWKISSEYFFHQSKTLKCWFACGKNQKCRYSKSNAPFQVMYVFRKKKGTLVTPVSCQTTHGSNICLTCCPCCWNKTTYYLGDFRKKRLPAIKPQDFTSELLLKFMLTRSN